MKKNAKTERKKVERARQKQAKSATPTQRELARILGISPALLNYHIKKPGAPDLADTDGWLSYLADGGREGSLPTALREAIGEARHRLIAAQAARLERQNRIASGEMVPVQEVRDAAGAAMGVMFASLDRVFKAELPPALAGLTASQIAVRCTAEIDRLKVTLRASFAVLEGIDVENMESYRAGAEAQSKAARLAPMLGGLSELDRADFLEWKRQRDAERIQKRRDWCRRRAAEGLPVPDASDSELQEFPGLTRS